VPIHYLRTANPLNPENLAAYPARIASNRSNPYVAPGGYSKLPLKVFGTYLCGVAPIPQLVTPGTLPSLPVPLPGDLTDLLPDTLRNGVDQFALGGGTVPAPPCTEQAPLGQVIGETGKYPQVKAAPPR
jgi:hypothetical protein